MLLRKLSKWPWCLYTLKIEHELQKTSFGFVRKVSTSLKLCGFWEKHIKSGYSKSGPPTLKSELNHVRSGLKLFQDELKLLKEELKETFLDDPPVFMEPGFRENVWKFNNKDVLEKWVVSSDKDHNQGNSECSVVINENRKALFFGNLRTELPQDGRIVRAGYCNMRSVRPRKSFKRDSYHEWEMFTHLILRIRGDGRSYMITLGTIGEWDIMWNDVYTYPLYTRGGPYWQITKIPFSKFFLSSKGRIQDKQAAICQSRITNVGITCGDSIPGPFSLEIDYIGLEYDPSHTEEFAYEMYQIPKFIADV